MVGVAAFLGSEVVLSPVVSGCLPSCGGWVLVGVAASRTKTFRNQNHRFQSKFAHCKLFGVYAGVICTHSRPRTPTWWQPHAAGILLDSMTANLRIHPTNGWSVRGLALAQWQPHLLFLQLRLCISALTQQIKCKWCSKDWKAMKVMKDTNSTWQMWNALKPSSYAMLWNMTFFTVFKLHFLQRQIQCDYFGVSNLSLRNQLITHKDMWHI